MRRLLDHDALSGVTTYHHYDESSGVTSIETVQDVTPVLERNKRIQTSSLDSGGRLNAMSQTGIKRGWWFVGSIPNWLIVKWRNEEGINVFDKNHWPALRRKLNDPEYKFLRTGTGRV